MQDEFSSQMQFLLCYCWQKCTVRDIKITLPTDRRPNWDGIGQYESFLVQKHCAKHFSAYSPTSNFFSIHFMSIQNMTFTDGCWGPTTDWNWLVMPLCTVHTYRVTTLSPPSLCVPTSCSVSKQRALLYDCTSWINFCIRDRRRASCDPRWISWRILNVAGVPLEDTWSSFPASRIYTK